MRLKFIYTIGVLFLLGCETEVEPNLDSSLDILVVDAWLTNNDPIQHINVTRSQPYFDEVDPEKVSGATVTVTDLTDPSLPDYVFEEQAERYTWESGDGTTFGQIGHAYRLTVMVDGATYTSTTGLYDVPPIDSISFRLEEGNAFFDDLFFAGFFATDLEGLNNTYWIKTWKNGVFLGKPEEINIAYDAAFSVDEDNDGVQFIQPIRDLISPIEENRAGEFLSPFNLPDMLVTNVDAGSGETYLISESSGTEYGILRDNAIIFEDASVSFESEFVPEDVESVSLSNGQFEQIDANTYLLRGDSVYVEIHSISNEAYFFLTQVQIETNREGGFGALFATPLANVSTNIIPDNPANQVAGFFNIAAVSSEGARLTSEDQIRVLD